MKEVTFVVESSPTDTWTARCLTDQITATADSMEELRNKIREAVKWHFIRETSPVVIKLKIAQDRVIPV